MDTKEILKKVRAIEIKTRGLSNQIFSGEYHSAFKGMGMAFRENREYVPGDEIRTIDWNVTARMRSPYVKVFEEERELTAMILVDVSGSGFFGTNQALKKNIITEIAAVLAFSAIKNNDKVGAILFSDKIEKFIPPRKGKSHILRIVRELVDFHPESKKTDISLALNYLNQVIKKKTICFLLSDFIADDFYTALKISNKKHDLIAIEVFDKAEEELPSLGIVPLQDLETGEMQWVNTSSKTVRQQYKKNKQIAQLKLNDVFRKSGVDTCRVRTDHNYVKPLMNLFKRRG